MESRHLVGGLVAAISCLLVPAQAGALSARPASRTVVAGTPAGFVVTLAGAQPCQVAFAGQQRRVVLADAKGVVDRISVRLFSQRSARPGALSIYVSCPGSKRLRLLVQLRDNPATGSHSGAAQVSVGIAHRRAYTDAEALAVATATWSPASLADFRNGQCTDWTAQKRPDVAEKVWESAYADQLRQRPQGGDAYTWSAIASAAGLAVGPSPAAGAIAVWGRGIDGADAATGHVAYVESVSPDGTTFTVSEMNADGGVGVVTSRTLSTVPVVGRTFIAPAAPHG